MEPCEKVGINSTADHVERDVSHDGEDVVGSDAAESVDSLIRAVARASYVAPGPAAGDVIGDNFRIEGKLGTGGMGVVYLARDLRLQRQIALKLHSGGDGDQRIEREARVLARLVHPNVVTVHDVGTWRGRTYIAMEYLDVGTLRSWLGARRRGWRDILTTFIHAGRGLEAAHHAGLVHRDFKPDNVLLGSDGRVRVADFGLARLVHPAAPEEPASETHNAELASSARASLTTTGPCMGTPGYMAPEAERGDTVDARADQYSFCVALSAALAGHKAPRWITPLLERGRRVDPKLRHPSLGSLLDAMERRMHLPRRWLVPATVMAPSVIALALWMRACTHEVIPAVPACPAPQLPALYVDATVASGGNGSLTCPFRTLTRALAVSTDRRVVHVGPGRYDIDHGEKLPLMIHGATEIRGTGAVIVGVGHFVPGPDALTIGQVPQRATLVVGDDQADVVLSGISIESGSPEAVAGNIGILCTRGNLHAFDGPVPEPNIRLERVTIGPGYDTGIIATGSTASRLAGCNLSVTDGVFRDSNQGIWQVGCGTDPAAPTALEVVNSSFRMMRVQSRTLSDDPDNVGIGISVWDCARRFHVAGSLFVDSDSGIQIVRHRILQSNAFRDSRDPAALIEGSQFARNRYGIALSFAVDVDLRENVFWGNLSGVNIHATPRQPPRVRGRDNSFWRNVAGIDLWGHGELSPDTVIDFGRVGDPGRNLFNCNAVKNGPAGATVAVQMRSAPGVSVGFAGNRWDHVPPRVRRGGPAGDRVEVALAGGPPMIEIGDAMWTRDVCARP